VEVAGIEPASGEGTDMAFYMLILFLILLRRLSTEELNAEASL